MKLGKFTKIFLIALYNFSFCLCPGNGIQNRYGLCSDQYCSEPFATGMTNQMYVPRQKDFVGFEANRPVNIYVSGLKFDLVGVEIDGKFGYAPKKMIKETRTMKRDLTPAIKEFVSLKQSRNQFNTVSQQPPNSPHSNHMPSVSPSNVAGTEQFRLHTSVPPVNTPNPQQFPPHASVPPVVNQNPQQLPPHISIPTVINQNPQQVPPHVSIPAMNSQNPQHLPPHTSVPPLNTPNIQQLPPQHTVDPSTLHASIDVSNIGTVPNQFGEKSAFVHQSPQQPPFPTQPFNLNPNTVNAFTNNPGNSVPPINTPSPGNPTFLNQLPSSNDFRPLNSMFMQGVPNVPQNQFSMPFPDALRSDSVTPQVQVPPHLQTSSDVHLNQASGILGNVHQPGISASVPGAIDIKPPNVASDNPITQPGIGENQLFTSSPSLPTGHSNVEANFKFDSSSIQSSPSSYVDSQLEHGHTLSSSLETTGSSSSVLGGGKLSLDAQLAEDSNFQDSDSYAETWAILKKQGIKVETPPTTEPNVHAPFSVDVDAGGQAAKTESFGGQVSQTIDVVPKHDSVPSSFINVVSPESKNSDQIADRSSDTEDTESNELKQSSSDESEAADLTVDAEEDSCEDECEDEDDETDEENEEAEVEEKDAESDAFEGVSPESTLPEGVENRKENVLSDVPFHENTSPDESAAKFTSNFSDDMLERNSDSLHQDKQSDSGDGLSSSSSIENQATSNDQAKLNNKVEDSTFQHAEPGVEPPSSSGDSIDMNGMTSDISSPEKAVDSDAQSEQLFLFENVTHSSLDSDDNELPNTRDADEYTARPTRSILQEDENVKLDTADSDDDEVNDGSSSESVKPESEESFLSFDVYAAFTNFISSLRAFLETIISFLPEPLYSYLMSLDASGISSRATVFVGVISIPVLLLFIAIIYLKEFSKEKVLIAELTASEHKLYLASTERDLLREGVGKLKSELTELKVNLEEERNLTETLQNELKDFQLANESVNMEQKESLSVIQKLKKQIDDYQSTITDLKKSITEANKEHKQTMKKLQDEQKLVCDLNKNIDKYIEEVANLQREKQTFLFNEKMYTEKISQLEDGCKQLLDDVKIWSSRVTELEQELQGHKSEKSEMETTIESKNEEIESLKSVILNLEAFESLRESGDTDDKTIEEKLTALLDMSAVQKKLERSEMETEALLEKLKLEQNKVLEMEVELLSSRSEVEKLQLSCNQAHQDKAQAQSKLNFLTEYFKEKEVQLQKELGAQENFRQQKELDVSQAERRIHFLEEENSSYKFQVATLKHEVEETERNLKKQIAAQEESAHKNWVAARAAERKAEELKQEVAQFRQRVTMLERERETLLNSSQADVVKPVPQRIADSLHDMSHDSSLSGEFIARRIPPPGPLSDPLQHPLPMLHPLLPPPPPPPMMPPPFLPPYDPSMPPHLRRPQPWHVMPERNPDFDRRNTPSDFDSSVSSRRHHTPPFYDREVEKRSGSPVDESPRSRSSSPLPDFHNIPPPVSRHRDFMPPRFPIMPPHMLRRDHGPPPVHAGNKSIGSGSSNCRGESQNAAHDRDYDPPRHHPEADV